VAAITSPAAGAQVGGSVTVYGSAAGQYTLMYGAGSSPASWSSIASGAGGVMNGQLGIWATDLLPAGDYTLRLIVDLPGNPEQEVRAGVKVDHAAMSVRLLQPAPDTAVKETGVVALAAEASGPVVRIEFRVDDQVAGGGDGPHASWNWATTGMGRHTVVAVAIGPDGSRVRSQPVVITVE
jgi:hypothetical protein